MNFFIGLFFLLGAILRQLPNIGASTWLNATIKNLGEYSKTTAEVSFKQKVLIFHMNR